MPGTITRSPCSTRKGSTNANTPVKTPGTFGSRMTSTRSPGRCRASARWPRRANIFALYYGIEQISWNGYARPAAMRHGTPDPPNDPQLPDYALVHADLEKGVSILDGRRI